MVERGELAGDVIGLIVGCRGGSDETNIARDGGKCRQQGDRLELRDIADGRAAERFDVRSAGADAVSHEDQVELCCFGHLRQADIVRKIGTGVSLRIWMAPGSDVVAGGIKKSSKF